MKVLVVHTMHSSTISEMLSVEGQEENYWGFLGFWNRLSPQLEPFDIEIRYLLSEAFLPLLERQKAIEKLQNIRNAEKYCLLEQDFGALWNGDKYPENDAALLASFGMGDYCPDVIVAHDDLKKLRILFPEAAMLGIEVGAYSRPPYPGTFYFDPYSFDCEKIVPGFMEARHDLTSDLPDLLDKIRSIATSEFNSIPAEAKEYLDSLKSRYEHTLLLAVQYPSPRYSPYTRHQSLLDLVQDALDHCPKGTAIVICPRAHNFQAFPISDADWADLRARYENILLFPADLMWPYYTQMLVPHVDGVIAVTSTVGLQAALWGKHWFTSPECFYTGVTPSYEQIKDSLAGGVSGDAADYVNWMSQYFWIPNLMLSKPALLATVLRVAQQSPRYTPADYLRLMQKELQAIPNFSEDLVSCYARIDDRHRRGQVIEIISL